MWPGIGAWILADCSVGLCQCVASVHLSDALVCKTLSWDWIWVMAIL